MFKMTRFLAGATGLAALAAAAPSSAQYYGYQYGYQANPYAYQSNRYGQQQYGYGNQYGYNNNYAMNTNAATQQCNAAVQSRLYNRSGIGGILGAVLGANTQGRVLGVTQIVPRQGYMRLKGLASSGRMAYNNYGPYGVGAYGGLGYNTASQADLSFNCDVDYNGYVRNVDIHRRY